MIVLDTWEPLREDALAIRREVFVVEQGGPAEDEPDAMDAQSLHAVAYDHNSAAIATGRLLPDGHIGRMAVRKPARGQGIGARVLQALMARAQELGYPRLALHAQVHACGFYEAHGFRRQGEPFMEAGIAHVLMVHETDDASTCSAHP